MPNKLFDYVGGCIPILSIGASDSSEFVKENDIGWNSDWGTNNIAQVLDNLTRNDILSKYNNLYKIASLYSKEHSYQNLVKFIMSDNK
ncbi:TPA: hypothetical protein PBR06_005383 [Escherichia coli]|nr:hypothetical protein [Escherichia coli]